jgi:hypothetical protein
MHKQIQRYKKPVVVSQLKWFNQPTTRPLVAVSPAFETMTGAIYPGVEPFLTKRAFKK